jgi:hypothetical protein
MEVGGLSETVEVTGGSPVIASSTTTIGTISNPNFGQPITSVLGGNPAQLQSPRQIRVGARLEF